MGVVYEAWQNSMDRRVALKVMPKAVAADTKAVARFIQEAQLAGKLRHPNIVHIHGMGVEEQVPYFRSTWRGRRWRRRHRAKLSAGAVVCLLLAFIGWFAYKRGEAELEAQRAVYDTTVLDIAAALYRGQLILAGDELYNLYNFKGRGFKGGEAQRSWKDAAPRLAAVAEAVPERPEARYYLARLHRLLGEEEAAIEEAGRALDADPAFAPAEVLREEIARKAFRLVDEILEGYLKRHRAGGGWQESWLLAYRYARDKRWPEAAEAYGRIIRWREERGAEPYLGCAVEAIMGRGLARLRNRNLEGAIRDFAAARSLWPRFPEAGLLLGKAYHQKGDREEAERVFEEVHEDSLREARSELATWVALLYALLGELGKRDSWLQKADEPDKLRISAFFHGWEGRTEEAVEALAEYERLAQDCPEWAVGYSGAASVLVQLGRYEEALARAERGVQLRPRNTPAYESLAFALTKLDHHREALKAAEAGIDALPGRIGPVLTRGLALEELGNIEVAARSYSQAIDLHPDSPEAHAALIALLKLHGGARALPELERLEEILARNAPVSRRGALIQGTLSVLRGALPEKNGGPGEKDE
ncbi:MAG: tetratricopeptide repeat protein [Planctomycetes bacterium]|nr:tetratricopeptide repeat protein [Planctomycetota bacterium]